MANYNDYLEYLKHIDNTTEQEIKTKIDGLNDEISNLKTSLSNLNKVKDDLTTDLANSKKQINEKVDLINLKETELKKVTSDLANVQKDLKDTNFKLTELEKMHNIEQKKNVTISNELAEIKSNYYILESGEEQCERSFGAITLFLPLYPELLLLLQKSMEQYRDTISGFDFFRFFDKLNEGCDFRF